MAKNEEQAKTTEAKAAAPVQARRFTKAEHDAKAEQAGDRKTVGKHSVADLEAGLLRNGGLPAGVSYSPYSKTPFVEVSEAEGEAVRASTRSFDRTVNYPSTIAPAVQAGTGRTAPVDASTPGSGGEGTPTT